MQINLPYQDQSMVRQHVSPAELEILHETQLDSGEFSIEAFDRCDYRPTSSEIDRVLYRSRLPLSSPGEASSFPKAKLFLHVDENNHASIRFSDTEYTLIAPMQDCKWGYSPKFQTHILSESEWQTHDEMLNLTTSPSPQIDAQIVSHANTKKDFSSSTSASVNFGLGIRGLTATNWIPSSPPTSIFKSNPLKDISTNENDDSQETTINYGVEKESPMLHDIDGNNSIKPVSFSSPSSPSTSTLDIDTQDERPHRPDSQPTLQDSDTDSHELNSLNEVTCKDNTSIKLGTIEEYKTFMMQELKEKDKNSCKTCEMEPVERDLSSPLVQGQGSFLEALCALEAKHSINCTRGVYQCNCSKKKFHNLHHLAQHLDQYHDPSIRPFVCPDKTCAWSVIGFNCRPECKRHILSVHLEQYKVCSLCKQKGKHRKFARSDALRRHIKQFHLTQSLQAIILPTFRTIQKSKKQPIRTKAKQKK